MRSLTPSGTLFLDGDVLTAERFRSQQTERQNGNSQEKWDQFKFVSLDFHMLMNLVDVS